MVFENRYHRRSIRREGYDYRDGGVYSITMCTNKRERMFGEIRNGMMGLNEWGSIVAECWMDIPKHFPGTMIDEFIVMPNHIHGILYLDDPAARGLKIDPQPDCRGAACCAPTDTDDEQRPYAGPFPGSLGAIIRSFKSAVTKRINDLRDAPGEPIWQRNFYEHICRTPEETDRIRSYILYNPRNWLTDDEFNDE